MNAAQSLFGTEEKRRFPLAPGAHVICANKGVTALRPADGVPNPDENQSYGVWSYIALSIAKNRDKDSCLFIEDDGLWTENDNEDDMVKYLDEHRKSVVWSIIACGKDQSVIYDRTFISFAKVIMQPGHIGTSITVGPYVTLAKNALPNGNFNELHSMTISKWEERMGF